MTDSAPSTPGPGDRVELTMTGTVIGHATHYEELLRIELDGDVLIVREDGAVVTFAYANDVRLHRGSEQ